MRLRYWLTCSLFLLLPLSLSAEQSKEDRLHSLFLQGVQLRESGKPTEALKVFEQIIAEEPKAPGSLFMAGNICADARDNEKAIDYLNRFHEIEPSNFQAIIRLIQCNQALRRDAAVEPLRKELYALRDSHWIAGLSDELSYVRERIPEEKGSQVIIEEYFSYKKPPFFLWEAKEVSAEGKVTRRLVLSYDEAATKKMVDSDPRLAGVEAFFLSEFVLKNGEMAQINIYRQESARPSYKICRSWFLDAIHQPPTPLLVQPIEKRS